jgi:hypothetical protein
MDKVRQLQRRLYVAAKRSPERRFHALYDRVFRGDILEEAWKRVRSNRGAAGVDRMTLAAVEEYGEERMLQGLQDAHSRDLPPLAGEASGDSEARWRRAAAGQGRGGPRVSG